MKISINAVRYLNQHYRSAGEPTPNGIDMLIDTIGAQLGGIEEVIDFGRKYDGVVIARIVSCQDHPNADRLHVCLIDDGGVVPDVERDDNGCVRVVCGAPNVREGLLVAWLPPSSTVPATSDMAEPLVLDARALRGVVSQGMLASSRELALSDDHSGIVEIDQDVAPGTYFAEAYHLRDDTVVDIENKMFTHRPDCFGWLGVAREIAGIQGQAYRSPQWYQLAAHIDTTDTLALTVRNEVPELAPRFIAIALNDVRVTTSPLWLQANLARAGIKSINTIVDLTNYYMLLTGQPLHAYDYDKLKARCQGEVCLVVRQAQPNESARLMNGKVATFTPHEHPDIVIATDQEVVSVAGIMGGKDTEVDANTTAIILECATFDMYSVRRTSMRYGLFTEASTRDTKHQSPLQNLPVLAKIVDHIVRAGWGNVASAVADDNRLPAEVMERGNLSAPVEVTADFINARLGLALSPQKITTLLENVEFGVQILDSKFQILPPFWRTDITIPEDIVEEVGRLYGYNHLPLELPARTIAAQSMPALVSLKSTIRQRLATAGANETLNYSFVHGKLLDIVGQERADAYQLDNALSPDLQYYRLSLTPSLLDKIHSNVKAGYDEFALFEIGKAHNKTEQNDENNLPDQLERVAVVYTADSKTAQQRAGAAYYRAYAIADDLFRHLGVAVSYQSWDIEEMSPVVAAWTAGYDLPRSSAIVATISGRERTLIGIVGEYAADITRKLKLPDYCAGFELDLHVLLAAVEEAPVSRYTKLSRFPSLSQDICLKVPSDITYQQVYQLMHGQITQHQPDNTTWAITPVDIYQRPDDPAHRQITLRLTIGSYERTMTDQEVTHLLDHVAETAQQRHAAQRV